MTKLQRKEEEFVWGKEQEDAFESLRQSLISFPCLAYLDMSKPFYVKPDWCEIALGAILTQFVDEGNEHPVAFASRQCRGKERAYSSRRDEYVALWWAVKTYWRPFLEGNQTNSYISFTSMTSSE